MRFAILGDIHSNLGAFRAVLKDIEQSRVDKIFSLGDLVGYGSDAAECIKLAREVFELGVLGNHDQAVLGKMDLVRFNDAAQQAISWTKDVLNSDEKGFLDSLCLVEEYKNMIFVHGTLFEPDEYHYLIYLNEARRNLDIQDDKKVCFIGHSHVPICIISCDISGEISASGVENIYLEKAKRYVVNVGSVGQPRDGDRRAAYVLYDEEKNTIELKRVEYDVDKVASRIISSGMPLDLGERLYEGR